MKKKVFGFIGAGTMGGVLIKGLLDARLVEPRNVLISDPDRERTAFLRRACRVRTVSGNLELARRADVILLAVKPQHLNRILSEIGAVLDRAKLLISIAAGVPLFQIEMRLKSPVRLVRAMPNITAQVGEGATALCYGRLATAADRKLIGRVFGSVGLTVVVEEGLMDAVTGLSGSGPAFVFSMIQSLADGGVQAGLPREVAVRLAAQTVLGSARLVLEKGVHPMQLRDQVASPAGTTIHGLAELEKGGFQGVVMAAVRAATERSRQLSEK